MRNTPGKRWLSVVGYIMVLGGLAGILALLYPLGNPPKPSRDGSLLFFAALLFFGYEMYLGYKSVSNANKPENMKRLIIIDMIAILVSIGTIIYFLSTPLLPLGLEGLLGVIVFSLLCLGALMPVPIFIGALKNLSLQKQ